ncbi:MAG TPA: hypothetical protein DFR83_28420, partial [Deltaproteobacteria bacterium]|nr:hypothetical protein [Deltaproteobacteria bacterium]
MLLESVVPYFDRLWWPGRFQVIVVLALVPLAAFGLESLAKRWAAHWVGGGFAALFGLQLVIGSPHHTLPASPP